MNKKIALSLLVPTIIILIRPFGISIAQSIVLGTLILTMIWWVTNMVNRVVASIFMLASFSIFGNTPLEKIFQFPLSSNFILVIFSFVFSEGIMNSKLTEKLLEPILLKVGQNIYKLLLFILTLNIILIFVIPQPFSRIIILGMILSQFFERNKFNNLLSEVLLFYTFSTAIFVNMMFKRGDIILNNALISIAQTDISEALWIKVMLVPTFIFLVISLIMFSFLFRRELDSYKYIETKSINVKKITSKDYRSIAIILFVVLLWLTEPLHKISSSMVIAMGIILMVIFKLITFKDLKSIDIGLLLFITAAFSIGSVMNNSGIAQIIFSPLSKMLPSTFGTSYILIVIMVSVIMHMALGSNITTIAVMIPSFMLVSEGVVPPVIIAFIIYISICAHYILPFHNVIILIGNGKNLYDSKVIARYGLPLTIVLILSIIIIYLSWWRIIGMV